MSSDETTQNKVLKCEQKHKILCHVAELQLHKAFQMLPETFSGPSHNVPDTHWFTGKFLLCFSHPSSRLLLVPIRTWWAQDEGVLKEKRVKSFQTEVKRSTLVQTELLASKVIVLYPGSLRRRVKMQVK